MNRLLSFEALMVLDAIERRGSFAAASEELGRAPSSLSYQVQKLEQDLDLVIFDRSGHKAVFTKAGRLLLERGRLLLTAADEMVSDATALAHGWELELTIAYDGLVRLDWMFPIVEALGQKSKTRVKFSEEILAGCWEALAQDRADILIAPAPSVAPPEVKIQPLGKMDIVWVAHPDNPIHRHKDPLDPAVRQQYRGIAVADTARNLPPITRNILEEQPLLTVSSMHDKLIALRAGLGIATIPSDLIQDDLAKGSLVMIGDDPVHEFELVLAWNRSRMGKAKSWAIQQLEQLWKKHLHQ
ncbi:LysR family transcriptional regulator [Photobacterium sp. 1_MG-2023]|uniref:LysR family transcriptional regulator n=1 Tax=Photobacterium sp. 1_MG-2023 TaxID=3062646 RepID=UPI0026E25CC7|nr:LysR family transcriptional regulator [Photobacterium sp. 1_MG-2023]MDO6707019.1 LysR family transcriptional regulator [Photobacterium sp. 1_MG-2023]